MATERRTKAVKRNNIYSIIIYLFLGALILLGFLIGRITKPAEVVTEIQTQTEIQEVIKTVEIPVYEDEDISFNEAEYYDVPLSHSLQQFIYEICLDEDVPFSLVVALIDHESNFNAEAVSATNDTGLMQINEVNFSVLEESYNADDMTNAYHNVYCGVKIIASYLNKYEDVEKALMAYNMGEYGASKAWENGIYSTTYTQGVLSTWEEYK